MDDMDGFSMDKEELLVMFNMMFVSVMMVLWTWSSHGWQYDLFSFMDDFEAKRMRDFW